MKPIRIAALLAAASLSACAYPDPKAADVGNPNHYAYAGEAGSFYDPAVNPPKDIGQVAYNPNQPLEYNLPAGDPMPRAATTTPYTAPVTAAPLTPVR